MRPGAPGPRASVVDTLLIIVFLVGIYLGVSPVIAKGVPIPAAPAGVAGMLLLLRNMDRIERRHVLALLAVLALYAASVLCADDLRFLKERAKGLLQISYALIVAYGLFITLVLYERERLARIFLGFCLFMVVGALLENHTEFRALSDEVRGRLYDRFLYVNDERDIYLYGEIRPKLFTSEPSALSFAFTLYMFCWFSLSTWRMKIIAYSVLLAVGYVLTRSPTVLLGYAALVPYDLLSYGLRAGASRSGAGLLVIARVGLMTVVAAVGLVLAASTFLGERYEQITSQTDPSFFYRVVGPARIAADTISRHPLAGAGLTGEEVIEGRVIQIYTTSSFFHPSWNIGSASEVLTNYFWLHWTYLGLFWGAVLALALTWFIVALGTPSVLFCWGVWILFGHASGAYVSPKTWTVLSLACAISVLTAAERRRMRGEDPVRPRYRRPVVEWAAAPMAGR
jgi:hypothetical protein